MFGKFLLILCPQTVEFSYKGTKWASPLQLPYPLNHEGLGHFAAPSAVTQ